MDATDPDHITITPLGRMLERLLSTKAVVATWVLLVPLLAVGAVTKPESAAVPLTANDVSVPKLVMLGCAAVDRVPVTLVPDRFPPLILPVTAGEPKVPTEVMLVCAAVVKVPDIAPAVTVPETVSDDSVPSEVTLG